MEQVNKTWGYEIIFANNPLYCGKILHFYVGKKCSLHFHIKKTETWYIYSGKYKATFINTPTATYNTIILKKGDIITNEPGKPHQLECIEEGDIFEVSTQHFDEDSYRISK